LEYLALAFASFSNGKKVEGLAVDLYERFILSFLAKNATDYKKK